MARPYRSHKVPACEACRTRKIRCAQNIEGAPCERCKRLGRLCFRGQPDVSFGEPGATTDISRDETARPPSTIDAASAPAGNALASPGMTRTARASSATLMVGAELSEDVNILQSYLSTRRPTNHGRVSPYHTIHTTPQESIVYVSVPRRRAGLELAKNPGKAQLEALQQLLGPSHHEELLALFAKHIQPYFPIIDLSNFRTLENVQSDKFPSTPLCYIYVLVLPLWSKSPVPRNRDQPDAAYALNLAIAALQSDFLSPTVSTVAAAILDLLGRPVKSFTTNILTIGKLVALAHSHGLHRDPTRWSSPPEPVSMRKRLWWGVLIHDHFGSHAYGTPPNISGNRHDVPMIDIADYAAVELESTSRHVAGSFTHLCALTQILGKLLNIIHDLTTDWANVAKTLRKIECTLDDWESRLCRLYGIDPGAHPPSKHCSLWLSYLSVRLLVQRLYLRAAASQTTLPIEGEKQYRTVALRVSAIAIVDFLASLTHDHFQEFWISHTAHFLVSTAIMLLRCTVESRDDDGHKHCITKLVTLQRTLEKASTESGWDIADLCLERCSDAIDRVIQEPSATNERHDRVHVGQSYTGGVQQSSHASDQETFDPAWLNQSYPALDLDLPHDSLDFLWDGM